MNPIACAVPAQKLPPVADAQGAYHTYSVEWTPDYIAWFFDGEEVRRSTGAQVTDCRVKEMSYRFNAWVSDVPSWAVVFFVRAVVRGEATNQPTDNVVHNGVS